MGKHTTAANNMYGSRTGLQEAYVGRSMYRAVCRKQYPWISNEMLELVEESKNSHAVDAEKIKHQVWVESL